MGKDSGEASTRQELPWKMTVERMNQIDETSGHEGVQLYGGGEHDANARASCLSLVAADPAGYSMIWRIGEIKCAPGESFNSREDEAMEKDKADRIIIYWHFGRREFG